MDITWALKSTAEVFEPTGAIDDGRGSVGYPMEADRSIICARYAASGKDIQRGAVLGFDVTHRVLTLPDEVLPQLSRLRIGTTWVEVLGRDVPQEPEYMAYWAREIQWFNGPSEDNPG